MVVMKEKTVPDYTYETAAKNSGFTYVCGVDEAGRGPLAGPVFAAAVILPDDCPEIEGLNDSKKLSEKRREAIFGIIIEKAVAYCVASASVDEIEEHNILNATFMAMKRAVEGLNVPADYAIIDGNRTPDLDIPCGTLIKGDSKSCSVAAASILAKVTRDRYITELDEKYPQYGFAKHKGYGTKAHTDAILEYGPCEIHRMSFLKKLLGDKK